MANNVIPDLSLVSEVNAPSETADILAQQERDQLFEDRGRENEIKKLFHNLLLWAIRIIFIIVIIVFLIRVAHFVMPKYWHWLTDEDLQSIDKFFFSGALGGLLSKHLNKIIK